METQTQTAELTARRQALANAINAHDVDAIKDFVHPSYVAKSRNGIGLTYRYQDILNVAALSFTLSRDFRETVEIEDMVLKGDTAELTTARHDSYVLFGFMKKRGDSRQVETWKQIDGKWMVVREELLELKEHVTLGRA